jgi:hypothetical protein
MPKELRWGSARRVAALSVVVVAVIAASVGVTIWRYEAALSRSSAAFEAHREAAVTEELVGLFWHEREAIREELINPAPSVPPEIRAIEQEFWAADPAADVGEPLGPTRHGPGCWNRARCPGAVLTYQRG